VKSSKTLLSVNIQTTTQTSELDGHNPGIIDIEVTSTDFMEYVNDNRDFNIIGWYNKG